MQYKVPFIKPAMPNVQELSSAYDEIVKANWFTNFGPKEQKFSNSLADYIGQGVSVTSVANATLGLILAVSALIGPRKTTNRNKVLVPSFTFAAVPESVIWCGLEPVFLDVGQKTWQVDVNLAESYINAYPEAVAGILFCNAFGVGAPDIEKWENLAKSHNMPLIIDSAAGFGSRYADGNRLGARGDCEIFSFHATKPFGVGEGAAVSSRNDRLVAKLRALENFGFGEDREAKAIGLNAKMQEINAAIGLWQLGQIDTELKVRQQNLALYKEALEEIGYSFQENDNKSTVCFVSAIAPDEVQSVQAYNKLRSSGIEVNRYYNPPLHKQQAFSGYGTVNNMQVTNDLCRRIISLPAHKGINGEIIQAIVSILKSVS